MNESHLSLLIVSDSFHARVAFGIICWGGGLRITRAVLPLSYVHRDGGHCLGSRSISRETADERKGASCPSSRHEVKALNLMKQDSLYKL